MATTRIIIKIKVTMWQFWVGPHGPRLRLPVATLSSALCTLMLTSTHSWVGRYWWDSRFLLQY